MSVQKLGNQAVLEEAENFWYKICGVLLQKLLAAQGRDPRTEFFIEVEDIEAFAHLFPGEIPAIVYHPQDKHISLQLLPMSEAAKKCQP